MQNDCVDRLKKERKIRGYTKMRKGENAGELSEKGRKVRGCYYKKGIEVWGMPF